MTGTLDISYDPIALLIQQYFASSVPEGITVELVDIGRGVLDGWRVARDYVELRVTYMHNLAGAIPMTRYIKPSVEAGEVTHEHIFAGYSEVEKVLIIGWV